MNRRNFIFTGLGIATTAALGIGVGYSQNGKQAMTSKGIGEMESDWRYALPEGFEPDLDLTPIKLSKQEWKDRLDAAAYRVLREEGTERAGSHPYNLEKREGVFLCAGCELPLFTSKMKYDSGTGWPSFVTVIPGHMETKKDFKLVWPRTEYHCIRCKGHQGHVFDDGPAPTGQRWCNNGVALKFLAKA